MTVATPPQTAEIDPAIAEDDWLEIDQFRFVQLLMFGTPKSVFDAHVPSSPVPVGKLTELPDEDPEDEGEEELGTGELDSLGAVGDSALVSLF